ncbi:MAG: hypothetical protein AAF772_00480 [Acidobacteriota bacterium]
MAPQTYEQFIADALQEGRQLGVQEGRQQTRTMLRRLIERRFGPLGADDRSHLDAIDDPDALDGVAERLFDAPSVAALLDAARSGDEDA